MSCLPLSGERGALSSTMILSHSAELYIVDLAVELDPPRQKCGLLDAAPYRLKVQRALARKDSLVQLEVLQSRSLM